ncbi:MAG: hypothetical protein WD875_03475 [Pirellulales bacterium]
MSKARKAFALRIDPALYQEIERWAQQEFRSINGQIEFVLRQAVAKRLGRGADVSTDAAAEDANRESADATQSQADKSASDGSDE